MLSQLTANRYNIILLLLVMFMLMYIVAECSDIPDWEQLAPVVVNVW